MPLRKTDFCLEWTLMKLFGGGSRAAATSKMEPFVIIVNGFQPLTIITNGFQLLTIVTKRSILAAAAALDPPLFFTVPHCPMQTLCFSKTFFAKLWIKMFSDYRLGETFI